MKATTLKELRQRKKMTLKEASKMLGVTEQYLVMLENGTRNPSDKLKVKLAMLYGVSATNIFLLCNQTKCVLSNN